MFRNSPDLSGRYLTEYRAQSLMNIQGYTCYKTMKRRRTTRYLSSGPRRKRRNLGIRKVVSARRSRMTSAPGFDFSNQRTGGYLGLEKKFLDLFVANGTISAPTDASGGEHDPGTQSCLNGITQGTSESNRIGRNVTIKSVQVSGQVVCPIQSSATTGDEAGVVKLYLVLDTQTNGAQLNSEDVFKNISGDARLAASPFRNLEFSKRFTILKKKKVTLRMPPITGATTAIEQQGFQIPFEMYHNFGDGMVVNYTGTGNTIAAITDNSLHIIAYTSSTGLGPKLYYNSRLRFTG